MGPPGAATPPELDSLRSMLRITKIITLVFLIIGLVILLLVAAAAAVAGIFGFFFIGPLLFLLLWVVIDLIIYLKVGEIQSLVDQGMYVRAKEKTLIWMILGLIFGGVLVGIFLILAYVKYDPVITWQRSMGGMPQAATAWSPAPASVPPPAWGQPASSPPPQPAPWNPPAQSAPASAPAPPMAPAAPAAPTCPRCGKPATWIPQYSRWYCYTDTQYL